MKDRAQISKWLRTAFHPMLAAVATALICGCLSGPSVNSSRPGMTAVQFPADRMDVMWERVIAVLNNNHFQVARESKLEGVIETHERAGSSVMEPWHHDSVGTYNRLESTLQSIRRRVYVTFINSSPGTVTLNVRAEKEIEDVPGLAATYVGGATFSENDPLNRDLDQAIGQAGPSRWISRGNDPMLEAELLRQIQFAVIR